MDWIRRNWPDLIIGFALLAVIAGIIATLLSGGSFFPFGSSVPNSGTQPAVVTPQVSQTPSNSVPATPDMTGTVTTETPPPGPPVTADEVSAVETQASESGASGTVTVISPEAPVASSDIESAESVIPLAPGTTSTNQASETTAPVVETSASTPSNLESGEASALFPESPYRISVGSYRDPSNAERRAEGFRAAGYPVFIGQQDDLSIVLVGPYNNRTEAEAVVATIQRDGLEAAPLLFELSDDPSQSASVVEAASTAASTTAEAVTSTTVQADVTPASTLQGSYLQAGAYDTSEGARPQRERLEGFGFTVAEVQEGSFVKLLVGPFSEDDLSSVQARLTAQGVDHFVRTF